MPTGSNIATAINAAHEAVEAAARDAARHALECGRLLHEAKATVQHGQWDKWIAAHCRFSPRTAQLYMRISKQMESDPGKAQRVADLSLRELERAFRTKSVAKPRLSDADESAKHQLLALWFGASPQARETFTSRLASQSEAMGTSLAQTTFPR